MRRKYLNIILVILMLVLPSVISINLTNHTVTSTALGNPVPPETSHQVSADTVTQLARTNVVSNPSFERDNMWGEPDYYSSFASIYAHLNFSYKDNVHGGSQAARLEGAATDHSSNYASFYRWFAPDEGYLAESQSLDMYYYIDNPGPIDHDAYTYVYIITTNSSNNRIYQYYILSYGTYNPTNGSISAYFMLNSSLNVWNHLSRNITQDIVSAIPSTATDLSRRVEAIYVGVYSPRGYNDLMSGVYDDIKILNGTGYDIVTNGDFEAAFANGWYGNRNSPGHITLSTDSTDGYKSLNLSSATVYENHYGYAAIYKNFNTPSYDYFPTSENTVTISFDWKYSDIYNGGGQYGLCRIRTQNTTGTYYLYYYLGYDNDVVSDSNSSDEIIMTAPGFGTRDQWRHFSIDLYDILTEVNWSNVSLREVRFYVGTGSYVNSTVQLLVDAFEIKTYTFGDPGFETTFWDTPTNQIATWVLSNGDASRVTRSADSHSGDYSANLTATDGQTSSIARYSFFTRIEPDTFFDISWKIAEMTASPTDDITATVWLYFEGGYQVTYYFAKSPTISLSNSTYESHITVKDVNTTGTWITYRWNLTDHLNASFGQHVWNLTQIQINAVAASGQNVVFLVDDIGLFNDFAPPTVSSVSQNPVAPMYYDPVDVTVGAQDDKSGVETVTVHYRISGGLWTSLLASESGGNYIATIPAQGYGELVEYYIEATDWAGNTVTDDNGGAYYSYTVGDDVDPTVSLDHPLNDTTITGEVWLNATASDAGSGIAFVTFQVDGVSIYNDTTAPFALLWNSRTVGNGSRTLSAVAYDVAGRTTEDSITVNVQNDVAPPQLTDLIVSPEEPLYGEPVTFSVGALDVSGVENVTIFYRMNGGSWTSALMTQSGILYRYTIPGQPYGTEVEYYVVAFDVFGTADSIGSSSSPLSYVVTDRIAPVLGVSGPSNLEPVQGTVSFQVSASDLGSGIDRVEFSVDGTLVESKAGGTFNWNTLDYENGNHTLTFTAYDEAGNTATFSIEYQVHNPVGVEGIGETLSSIIAQYGLSFILGAATVVIIIVVIKIIDKKRGGT